MLYKTYLFDFDYTLADSSKGIVLCFEKLLAQNGYPGKKPAEIKRTIGLFMPQAISILTGETAANTIKLLQKRYSILADKYMTKNTFLYSETIPAMKKLKQQHCLIGIVSNKTRHRILETLHQEKITDTIDVIIGTENAKKPKPAPEPIWQAIEALHTDSSTTLYIGDSLTDAQTAFNAKVDFSAVLTGETQADEFNKYPHKNIFHSLAELC
ncbi:HAD family hydrolase [Pectinatus frisingensis]|uniref:HAD family hydrolase n=1 Tax=Pectinatus frisingensis TaxID=865 RepID=UPI0018C7226D|nr:HAD family hydrolase [Pectinatus frisingensis]